IRPETVAVYWRVPPVTVDSLLGVTVTVPAPCSIGSANSIAESIRNFSLSMCCLSSAPVRAIDMARNPGNLHTHGCGKNWDIGDRLENVTADTKTGTSAGRGEFPRPLNSATFANHHQDAGGAISNTGPAECDSYGSNHGTC